MYKRLLLVLVVLVAFVELYLTSSTIRTNSYLSDLVEIINARTTGPEESLTRLFPPMVKEDRKDEDQFDILTMYTNKNGDLISKVMILPDGITEPFRMSVLTLNITNTEEKFTEKNEKNPLPTKLNNHKLMKPCKGEVEIPVLDQRAFQVHNLTSIEPLNEKYSYHNLGYCTKLMDLSDRYIEIDGKSAEKSKFKFEYNLPIMHLLYPEKYAKVSTMKQITGWKYFFHFLALVLLVAALLLAHYIYINKIKNRVFQKVNSDIELQNTAEPVDISEFEIDDDTTELDSKAKKSNKKVSFKDAEEEEVRKLL